MACPEPARSRLSSGDIDFDAEWAEDDLQVTHISSNLIREAKLDIEAFDGETLWEPPKFSGLSNSVAGGFVDLEALPPPDQRPSTPIGDFVNLVPMWDDWGDLFAEAEALRPTESAMRQAAEEVAAAIAVELPEVHTPRHTFTTIEVEAVIPAVRDRTDEGAQKVVAVEVLLSV